MTKFLGVLVDENLTWKHHINYVHCKVSKGIGILYKAKYILIKKLLKQLYYSFVNSYLSYGNMIWASNSKTKLEPLFRRQKHAVRIICHAEYTDHSAPLFEKYKILTLHELNIFQILTFMFKCKIKQAPSIFHNLYSVKPMNKYQTRNIKI